MGDTWEIHGDTPNTMMAKKYSGSHPIPSKWMMIWWYPDIPESSISPGWKVCAKIRSTDGPRLVLLLFRMNSAMHVMWKPQAISSWWGLRCLFFSAELQTTKKVVWRIGNLSRTDLNPVETHIFKWMRGVPAAPAALEKPGNDECSSPDAPSSHSSAQPTVVDPPGWVLHLSESVSKAKSTRNSRSWF